MGLSGSCAEAGRNARAAAKPVTGLQMAEQASHIDQASGHKRGGQNGVHRKLRESPEESRAKHERDSGYESQALFSPGFISRLQNPARFSEGNAPCSEPLYRLGNGPNERGGLNGGNPRPLKCSASWRSTSSVIRPPCSAMKRPASCSVWPCCQRSMAAEIRLKIPWHASAHALLGPSMRARRR